MAAHKMMEMTRVAEPQQKVHIALNVVRARITVVGFCFALIAFQLLAINRVPGGIEFQGIDTSIQFYSATSLLIALALSVLAIVSFISSIELTPDGACTRWILLAGDLFMYQALAHNVSSFFTPIAQVMDHISLNVPNEAAEMAIVRTGVIITGGFAWFAVTYLGPVVSLLRSPFGMRVTAGLACAYVLLLMVFAYVGTEALRLDQTRAGLEPDSQLTFFAELLQPLRW